MSNRRDKGQGYISKKPDKSGRFKGYITVGYKEDGTPIRIYKTAKTRAEVKRLLKELIEERTKYTDSDEQTTLASYLEMWLSLKEQELKTKSFNNYKSLVDKHLVPRLGHLSIGQLVPLDTQLILHDIAKNHGARTSNYARSVLISALNQAVELEVIDKNPLEKLRKVREEKRKPTIWTTEEMRRFLDVIKEHRLYALFHLALSTGLRHGELLGIQWEDLEDGQLHIQRSVSDISGKAFVSTPKTETSNRYVALSEDSLQVLEEHRLRQEEEKAYLAEAWTETGHIFVTAVGTLFLQRGITRTFASLQKKASVPKARLHDVRHMHVSLLIENNVDPRMVADRIGHVDAAFTLKTYAHIYAAKRKKAAIPLETLISHGETESEEDNKGITEANSELDKGTEKEE